MKTLTFTCKVLAILMMAICCLFSFKMTAQTIQIDSTFTSDGEIFPFGPNDTIYGLSISGHVTLSSDTSLVRVILTDNAGNEWMVYEAYPMIVNNMDFDIEEECDETCFLEEFYPHSLKIQIIAADLDISHLSCSSIRYGNLASLQQQAKQTKDLEKVQLMNQYIASKGWNWIAGDNELLGQYYSVKAMQFGYDKYNVRGFDYYISGEFKYITSRDLIKNSGTFRNEFDWNSKHDANIPFTPYYDPKGWLTDLRSQYGCGACWVFGPVASVEAVANLYFNQHCDYNLSEHDVLCCSGGGNCDGGDPGIALNYLNDPGTFNEEHHPYEENGDPWYYQYCCHDDSGTPDYIIKCETIWQVPTSIHSLDTIKSRLITTGPLVTFINSSTLGLYHVMSLFKYYTDEVTQTIHFVFKDSYGGGRIIPYELCWNDISEIYSIRLPLTLVEGPVPEIKTWDKDADGYYNWGIGSIPENWAPPCSPENPLEDWNDNNNRVGPHDINFNGIPVKPEIQVCWFKNEFLPKVYVENDGFFYFDDQILDDLDDNTFIFRIENPGSAQLNLTTIGGAVTSSNQDNFLLDINNLDASMCMLDGYTEFSVTFIDDEFEDNPLTVIHINVASCDEDVLTDFYFAMVYYDCRPASGLEPITQDENWEGFQLKMKDYIIQPGKTLRILGNISMAPEADIFIDRGGKLIINGGRLTGSCDNLWNGIDVWGDRTKLQSETTQGVVRIYNGGTIEYAECAIENIHRTGGELSIFTGGIFEIEDAIFKDNFVAIKFWPYHNSHPVTGLPANNTSHINKSEFKTTQDLYDLGYHPDCFISMTEVEGVKILGCNFHNELDNIDAQGIGIVTTAADFIVDNYCTEQVIPCPDYAPGHFENLEYGIYAAGITSVERARITNSEFINNRRGIYLSACVYPEITQNIFEVRKAENVPFYNAVYCGLYLDNCTQYDVEENYFYTFLDEQEKEDLVSTGLIVNNSGEENNEIYNNIFDGLYSGIIAQEVNRNREGDLGLQIKCNNLLNNIYDIAVTHDDEGITGIAEKQGLDNPNIAPPAGNRFTFIDPGLNPEPDGNYYNDCENINYYYHEDPNGYKIVPLRHTNEPVVDPKSVSGLKFIPDEACPSNFNGGGSGILEEKSYMLNAGSKADSIQSLLGILTDGGDTQGLLSDIQFSWPEDGCNLYSDLITESPYLSDTTIIKAVEKENVLLPGMITDVLIANPQSAKSDKIMNTVDERSNPLTDDQLADIGEGRFITGAKEVLESEYASYLFSKDQSKNKLIRFYKTDTLCESPEDSIIDILSFQPELSDEYRKSFEYFEKGDSLNVVNTLEEVPLFHDLTDNQEIEHALYQDYFDILFNSDTSGSVILNMHPTQKLILHNVLDNSNGILKVFARNILRINDSLDYSEPIILPQPGLKSAKVKAWPEKRIQIQNTMNIYPNPAKNAVIIEVRLNGQPQNAFIKMIDNRGIILKSFPILSQDDYMVIPLNEFSSGNVFCQLNINNKIIETKKLLIFK
jgi:hypothetical protein